MTSTGWTAAFPSPTSASKRAAKGAMLELGWRAGRGQFKLQPNKNLFCFILSLALPQANSHY